MARADPGSPRSRAARRPARLRRSPRSRWRTCRATCSTNRPRAPSFARRPGSRTGPRRRGREDRPRRRSATADAAWESSLRRRSATPEPFPPGPGSLLSRCARGSLPRLRGPDRPVRPLRAPGAAGGFALCTRAARRKRTGRPAARPGHSARAQGPRPPRRLHRRRSSSLPRLRRPVKPVAAKPAPRLG